MSKRVHRHSRGYIGARSCCSIEPAGAPSRDAPDETGVAVAGSANPATIRQMRRPSGRRNQALLRKDKTHLPVGPRVGTPRVSLLYQIQAPNACHDSRDHPTRYDSAGVWQRQVSSDACLFHGLDHDARPVKAYGRARGTCSDRAEHRPPEQTLPLLRLLIRQVSLGGPASLTLAGLRVPPGTAIPTCSP